ncbi:hypothetical protein RJT34_19828 [Clitoria ternatea]|uniref:Uncharacterized protein n=1 Tax=Clitoria ternatea TaxID=43366 RepID=A0AAN9IRR7_CLITE
MDKMIRFRSLFRSVTSRSYHAFAASPSSTRTISLLSPPSTNPLPSPSPSGCTECRSPFSMGLGSKRFFSEDVSHMPNIKDPELQNAFKDLLAENWSELPDAVVYDVKNALSKNTDDKAGKEVVENVFRAAEAVQEFGGILVTLRMEIDDSIGSGGEKVEAELGTQMIHLKMRCSGLGAEWGKFSARFHGNDVTMMACDGDKSNWRGGEVSCCGDRDTRWWGEEPERTMETLMVTVLGTSGLAGSFVEQRAPFDMFSASLFCYQAFHGMEIRAPNFVNWDYTLYSKSTRLRLLVARYKAVHLVTGIVHIS